MGTETNAEPAKLNDARYDGNAVNERMLRKSLY